MRLRSRLVLAATVVAVLAPACSSVEVAATVGGSEITDAEVLALAARDESATTVQAGDPCRSPEGASPDDVCIGFREDLTALVFLEAATAAAAEDYGITGIGTEEARDAFLTNASPEVQQIFQTLPSVPERGTQAFGEFIVDRLDVQERVETALIHDEGNLVTLWEQRPEPEIDYCVKHILVATQEEAVDVLARIGAGENFSQVASEVSLDNPSGGGFLPCPTDPSSWVPPFAEAVDEMGIGEVSDPVETEFGWHIIAVDSRRPGSIEELVSDPELWVPEEAIDFWWSEWFVSAVARADIDVRSQIGTWSPESLEISPPPDSP
jgi:parvulin-like peptidyl-prolyl isomerase